MRMTAKHYFISAESLSNWLDGLANGTTLIAPRELEGLILYRPVASSAEIAWGSPRPVLSAREVFFPSTERLLVIEKTGQQVTLTETLPKGRQVLFGMRPCDARGAQILDALFLRHQPTDPYYARRRENTTLVGLACREMGPTCFCTSVGSAPDDPSGLDVLLTEVEGGYAVQIITEKGEKLLAGLRLEAFDGELPAPALNDPLSVLPKEAWPAHFSDPYWARLSRRCLSCRVCSYACPTCRCFDVRDESISGNGNYERLRCWDSCSSINYRRIAGGHNPRAAKEERLRNRFFCKFYYYPEQYAMGEQPACTGCGRCIDLCPVNIDITEVLADVGRLA
jgi:ferredoxin